ncbi:vitamin B12 dependent-methionine synthase activation domain-containing protein [Chloroflexota bacterium]
MIQDIREQILTIDRNQLLNQIGYDDSYQMSSKIKSLVDGYLDNYHNLIESSFSYVIKDIESIQESQIILEDSIILQSSILARLLERCEQTVIFALTIGNHLEDMTAYLADNGHVLQATVLDAIGSNATEQLAFYVEDVIGKLVGYNGLVISRRFSPGYCDWDVSQQEMIFRALQEEPIDIRLTEEYLMLPRKSISGIIGIGSSNNAIESYNPCSTCQATDCPGRRELV